MTYWNLHKKFELPMTNVHRDLTFQSWVFLIGGEPNNCSALILGIKENVHFVPNLNLDTCTSNEPCRGKEVKLNNQTKVPCNTNPH